MAELTEQRPNLYALLIGIDFYEPNRLYKSLKGCVRDINLVNAYLQTSVHPVHTWKLLSPNPEVFDLAEIQSTQENISPTYANIINAFTEITETAQAGDLIYIHYSGHGGRAATVYPDLKGEGQNDEGIVPLDIGDHNGRYIRDVEIATLLKRMTDKGLIVTLVLDSCHSGGATRGDAEIRSAAVTDMTPRSAESLVASRQELVNNWLNLTQMTRIGAAGLPETRDYVLLAACRPNEYAYEYAVQGSDRHGALTYWMINTLTSSASSGQPLTYKLLHDRINAQIQSKFPQQLPMLLGESNRLVFGRDRWSTPYTVSVIGVDLNKAQVTLNAGLAQGLSRGTRFAIYPLHTTEFTDKRKQVAIVEVIQVEAAGAVARLIHDSQEGGIGINGAIEPGAPAVMTSAPVDLIRRVRLFDQKTQGEQENELPLEWVEQQTSAMEAVRQALQENGWLREVEANTEADYQVAVGRNGAYEICIGTPIENLRPALNITDPTAAEAMVQRLVHLAKYQAVQSLSNPSSKLAELFDVELLDADQRPFPDAQIPTIHTGDIICLRLNNRGMQSLKVAVLDLEPTWAISQLPLQGIEAPFYNLDAGEKQEIKLSLTLPDDEEYRETKETLKVFAIQKGVADFRWLTLPALDQPPETRGVALDAALQELAELPATRGEAEGVNPLNRLLATIGADLDQAPTVTRAAAVVLDPNQEWITKQIQIIVKQ